MKIICEFSYDENNDIKWVLKKDKKKIFKGVSSDERFLKQDASYFAEDVLKTDIFEIEYLRKY